MHEAHRLHLALDGFGHELFDFEPRLIHLPNPPARPGILSSLKR